MESPDDKDMILELAALLERVGARVTIDPERNNTKPCLGCGSSTTPRQLIEIGVYTMDLGSIRKGDPIFRPLCTVCIACPEPNCQRLRGHAGLHMQRHLVDGEEVVDMWAGKEEP